MQMELDSDILNRAEVDYGNLNLSKEDKAIVKNLLRRIMYLAPANAKIKLELVSQKGFVSSTISVKSIHGPFDASVVGETLQESLDFLHQDIVTKINVWKRKRFSAGNDVQAS